MKPLIEQISKYRLAGEPCPKDLELLITHCGPLLKELGIEINGDATWAPWTDKSYLSEAAYRDPDVVANVKAIDDTFELVRFIAKADGGEYIGYWRGPEERPISQCPLVYYDTEGQFRLCGGRFVEALFFVCYGDDTLDRLRTACTGFGLKLEFSTIDDIAIPQTNVSPDAFHQARYAKYKGS